MSSACLQPVPALSAHRPWFGHHRCSSDCVCACGLVVPNGMAGRARVVHLPLGMQSNDLLYPQCPLCDCATVVVNWCLSVNFVAVSVAGELPASATAVPSCRLHHAVYRNHHRDFATHSHPSPPQLQGLPVQRSQADAGNEAVVLCHAFVGGSSPSLAVQLPERAAIAARARHQGHVRPVPEVRQEPADARTVCENPGTATHDSATYSSHAVRRSNVE